MSKVVYHFAKDRVAFISLCGYEEVQSNSICGGENSESFLGCKYHVVVGHNTFSYDVVKQHFYDDVCKTCAELEPILDLSNTKL